MSLREDEAPVEPPFRFVFRSREEWDFSRTLASGF